jgi:hypothetical protein
LLLTLFFTTALQPNFISGGSFNADLSICFAAYADAKGQ